jgi:hypothetical protein
MPRAKAMMAHGGEPAVFHQQPHRESDVLPEIHRISMVRLTAFAKATAAAVTEGDEADEAGCDLGCDYEAKA